MSNNNICYGCREEMPSGVKFCASCGKHNFSADNALGESLADHAKKLSDNRDASNKMKGIWPSSFGRWLIWLFRKN